MAGLEDQGINPQDLLPRTGLAAFGVNPRELIPEEPRPATPPVPEVQRPEVLRPEVEGSAFFKGLFRGSRGVESALRAAAATAMGDTEELERAVVEQRATAAMAPARVGSFTEIEGVGDALDYAAGALGEGVPSLLGSTAGALAGMGMVGPPGALMGGAAVAFPLETGATAAELFEATGEPQRGLAVGAGALKSLLEAVVPARLVKLGIGREVADELGKGILRRGLREARRTGAQEFTTEGLQEVVDVAAREFVDENFDTISTQTATRIIDAAMSGLIVGGVAGGAMGVATTRRRPPPPPTTNREAADMASRAPATENTVELPTGGSVAEATLGVANAGVTMTQGPAVAGESAAGRTFVNRNGRLLRGLPDGSLVGPTGLVVPPDQVQFMFERDMLTELSPEPTILDTTPSRGRSRMVGIRTAVPRVEQGTAQPVYGMTRALDEQGLPVPLELRAAGEVVIRTPGVEQGPGGAAVAQPVEGDLQVERGRGSEPVPADTGAYTQQPALEVTQATEAPMTQQLIMQELDSVEGLEENYRHPSSDPVRASMGPLEDADAGRTDPGVTVAELPKNTDRFHWWMRWTSNIYQLAERNPHIAELQEYRQLLDEWSVEKMRWISRSEGVREQWQALDTTQKRGLGNLLRELDRLEAWPDAAEMAGLQKKHGLNEQTVGIYDQVRGLFDSVLGSIEQARTNEILRNISDPQLRAEQLQELQAEMAGMRSSPYFPLQRFGKWAVTVRDAAGNVTYFETFESRAQRKLGVRSIRKDMVKGETLQESMLSEQQQSFRGLSPAAIKSLASKLSRGMSPEQAGELMDSLQEIIAESSPGRSFSKRFLHRSGTPGASKDGLRVFSDYFFHAANHLARLQWGDQMQEQVNALQAQGRGGLRDANIDKRMKIADYVDRHFGYAMEPTNEWQALRSFGFMMQLGWAVDSALVNLSQVPLVTQPFLASRFAGTRFTRHVAGPVDAEVAATIMGSFADVRNLYTRAEAGDPKMHRYLGELQEQEILDESQAVELAATADPPMLERLLGSGVGQTVRTVRDTGVYFFRTAERVNRRVTARAAIKLALRHPENWWVRGLERKYPRIFTDLTVKGFDPTEARAILAGRDAVTSTQFQYARHARPELLRGPKGALLLFYNYPIQMMHFIAKDSGRVRYVAMLLALAGTAGLPFARDLLATGTLLQELARRMGLSAGRGEPNLEIAARRWLNEMLDDPRAAERVMYGFGKSGLGFDVSRRFGFGEMVPGSLPNLASTVVRGGDFQDVFAGTTEDIMGAGLSPAFAIGQSLFDHGNPDSWKRAEGLLPRAMRNVSQGIRMGQEGGVTDRRGALIHPINSETTPGRVAIMGKALGFVPAEVSQKWDVRRAQQEALMYQKSRQLYLLAELDLAVRARNRAEIREAQKNIRRYNAELPKGMRSLRINGQQIEQSLSARARGRVFTERGIALQRKYRPLFEELDRLYGVER